MCDIFTLFIKDVVTQNHILQIIISYLMCEHKK